MQEYDLLNGRCIDGFSFIQRVKRKISLNQNIFFTRFSSMDQGAFGDDETGIYSQQQT